MDKLTKSEVEEIVAVKRRVSVDSLVKKYNVSPRVINMIWKKHDRQVMDRTRKTRGVKEQKHTINISLSPKAYVYLCQYRDKSLAVRSILERLADNDAANKKK